MTVEAFIVILLSNLGTLIVSSMFYASRLEDLRVAQRLQIDRINDENEMVRRLYGSIPIEKLIGREDAP